MRRIRRFLNLPCNEKWLLCKAVVLVLIVRLALVTLRYTRTHALLVRFNANPPKRLERSTPPAQQVAWLVHVASRFVPGGQHCLTKALATESLLTRRGFPAQTEIGVARDPDGKLVAHAWVRCGGEVVIGGEDLRRYTELVPPR